MDSIIVTMKLLDMVIGEDGKLHFMMKKVGVCHLMDEVLRDHINLVWDHRDKWDGVANQDQVLVPSKVQGQGLAFQHNRDSLLEAGDTAHSSKVPDQWHQELNQVFDLNNSNLQDMEEEAHSKVHDQVFHQIKVLVLVEVVMFLALVEEALNSSLLEWDQNKQCQQDGGCHLVQPQLVGEEYLKEDPKWLVVDLEVNTVHGKDILSKWEVHNNKWVALISLQDLNNNNSFKVDHWQVRWVVQDKWDLQDKWVFLDRWVHLTKWEGHNKWEDHMVSKLEDPNRLVVLSKWVDQWVHLIRWVELLANSWVDIPKWVFQKQWGHLLGNQWEVLNL